jgi:hypothetical protein
MFPDLYSDTFFSSVSGLLSWDVSFCHVDLEKELGVITDAAPPGEELRGGQSVSQSMAVRQSDRQKVNQTVRC